jgi:hypothetical protein
MKKLKTSEEWQKEYPNPKVYDPDGWDRKNWQYSWYEEKISYEEYQNRIVYSTCLHNIPLKESK